MEEKRNKRENEIAKFERGLQGKSHLDIDQRRKAIRGCPVARLTDLAGVALRREPELPREAI